ncbi:hypothetical protein L1987_60595 [Smallanthus sonchifolius]|uniref:Uncharacterized protein n=1 Tax=Smallanthus sonchifolius TaxID=185202 RepID=A0ACB9D8J0_9ASTR|nr:hypothetical protein L1987_60595 [Smallanthus sonchifolius]
MSRLLSLLAEMDRVGSGRHVNAFVYSEFSLEINFFGHVIALDTCLTRFRGDNQGLSDNRYFFPFWVEKLKRFIPRISDAFSKHEQASPDTACYYGCGNTPSETAPQLRLACGDHSRQKGASLRSGHDSSSFGNDKI